MDSISKEQYEFAQARIEELLPLLCRVLNISPAAMLGY